MNIKILIDPLKSLSESYKAPIKEKLYANEAKDILADTDWRLGAEYEMSFDQEELENIEPNEYDYVYDWETDDQLLFLSIKDGIPYLIEGVVKWSGIPYDENIDFNGMGDIALRGNTDFEKYNSSWASRFQVLTDSISSLSDSPADYLSPDAFNIYNILYEVYINGSDFPEDIDEDTYNKELWNIIYDENVPHKSQVYRVLRSRRHEMYTPLTYTNYVPILENPTQVPMTRGFAHLMDDWQENHNNDYDNFRDRDQIFEQIMNLNLATDTSDWTWETDSSIDKYGIEVIGPPSEPVSFFHDMKLILNWMRQETEATESTGFHVGISHEGWDFSNIDKLKLALFLEEGKVYASMPSRKGNSYAGSLLQGDKTKRGLLAKLKDYLSGIDFNKVTPKVFFNNLVEEGFEEQVRRIWEEQINITEKYYGVNFSKIKDGYLEFRYMGGAGYDQKFDEIKSNILSFMKAIAIAMDPASHQKEYLKKLVKTLTKLIDYEEKLPSQRVERDYIREDGSHIFVVWNEGRLARTITSSDGNDIMQVEYLPVKGKQPVRTFLRKHNKLENTGFIKRWDDTGVPISEEEFLKEKYIKREFFPEGNVRTELIVVDNITRKTGYSPSTGNKAYEYFMKTNEEGITKNVGIARYWYEDGSPSSIIDHDNRTRIDYWNPSHGGGIQYEEQFNSAGVAVGLYKAYDKKGNLQTVKNLNDKGQRDGLCQEYEDGKLAFQTEFKNGQKDGWEIYYSLDTGKPISKKLWRNGELLKEE